MKTLALLVTLFEESLEIPRAEAVKRVIKLILCVVCSLVVIGLTIVYFPYASSFTEKFPLLSGGSYVQVSKILDGEVLVDRTQFLKVAEGNITFVSILEGKVERNIIYMTKVGGMSYRYEQNVPTYHDYSVSSFRVENEKIVVEMEREMGTMIGTYIVLPLCLLALLSIAFSFIQAKKVSGFRDSAVYNSVWY